MAEDKNKQRLYGQLVVDFVNAETSDEACVRLFENIQQAFKFSQGFVQRALEFLPLLTSFSLPHREGEKELFELLLQEKKLIRSIEWEYKMHGVTIKNYDRVKGTFVFPPVRRRAEDEVCPLMPVQRIPQLEKLRLGDLIEEGPDLAERLEKLRTQILDAEDSVSRKRFIKLDRLSSFYFQVLSAHAYVDKLRMGLRGFLADLVKGINLYESDLFRDLFSIYKYPKRQLLKEDGSIVEEPMFRETYFLRKDLVPQLKPCREVVAYCAVQFLGYPWNRKLIHNCEECGIFYISKSIRPSCFCSDKCRLAWHNRKRITSGEAAEYKRRKRKEGAKESYYG